MEKDIVRSIMVYLNGLPGCFAFKQHGGMYSVAGIPDIVGCYKGQFFAFEVKTPRGRLSMLQARALEKIRLAGGMAAVVTSLQEAKQLVGNIDVGCLHEPVFWEGGPPDDGQR